MKRITKKLMENDDIKKVIYIERTTIETAIDLLRMISTSERRRKKI